MNEEPLNNEVAPQDQASSDSALSTQHSALTEKLAALPDAPGVYLHKNAEGKVIYIGKARNLRNRVRSYFNKDGGHSAFTRKMVRLIADFETIVTRTEKEALILENNLVKMHKPHFNIRLKDDKRYPYLKLTLNETYPALLEVRQPKNDKALYFGPYAGSGKMRQTVSLAKRVFKVRTGALMGDRRWGGCPWRDTSKLLDKPCLEYYIDRCSGPCIAAVATEEYQAQARALKNFLEGRSSDLLKDLEARMTAAATNLEFETAAKLRDQIEAVKSVIEKQQVVSLQNEDYDALGLFIEAGVASVTTLVVRNGKLIGDQHFFLQNIEGRSEAEVISAFVRQHYAGPAGLPDEILTPYDLEDGEAIEEWLSEKAKHRVGVRRPQRGDKVKVIEMAAHNAEHALREHLNYNETAKRVHDALLEDLQKHLKLEVVPRRIECFDISTVQGAFSVGSMVVFTDGKVDKKAYRHFTIKHTLEITGGKEPNDFEMMREVLRRRLQRAAEGDEKFLPLPDLLMVDGGKGQLSAALMVLQEKNYEMIPTVGLAKQHELLFVPDKSEPIALPRNSPALHLLQRIRDEAHRFAITHHRKRRGKAAIHSLLDDIPGIGEARRNALLEHFGSLQKIRAASLEEIAAVPGMTRPLAEKMQEYLQVLTKVE
ncbi:MAG: excinuclease ABC subunit UvrC [Armatimonadota bacterium]|nr:excinuclease ABC subunit UvrC [Armatimonadota bacterium]